jgi:hypothetical protein
MPETPNLVIGDNGWQHAPGRRRPAGRRAQGRQGQRPARLPRRRPSSEAHPHVFFVLCVYRQGTVSPPTVQCVAQARVDVTHIYCMHAAGARGPTRREQRKGATCDAGVRHVRRLVVRTRWNAMHMIMHDDR